MADHTQLRVVQPRLVDAVTPSRALMLSVPSYPNLQTVWSMGILNSRQLCICFNNVRLPDLVLLPSLEL